MLRTRSFSLIVEFSEAESRLRSVSIWPWNSQDRGRPCRPMGGWRTCSREGELAGRRCFAREFRRNGVNISASPDLAEWPDHAKSDLPSDSNVAAPYLYQPKLKVLFFRDLTG
jgi:hypothetical protein